MNEKSKHGGDADMIAEFRLLLRLLLRMMKSGDINGAIEEIEKALSE